jgi:hypothetical protein
MNVWRCKRCREWGIGGPQGFVQHEKSAHVYSGRFGAQVSFGFTGQYSDGYERRYDRYVRPAVAREES